jgi:uncharacterized metal-binding protein YceD (DUF177 family)
MGGGARWVKRGGVPVRELFRSTDAVQVSWAVALLSGEGIEAEVLDLNTSLIEGSIMAIPRRVVCADADYRRARHLLAETGQVVLSPDKAPW